MQQSLFGTQNDQNPKPQAVNVQRIVSKNLRGMSSHHSANMGNDEWLTPPDILKKLGEFDLDPCSPINRPWSTAKQHYTSLDDGLSTPWHGRVWCNPPYGLEAANWLSKLAAHGQGTALIFARTETKMFFYLCMGQGSRCVVSERAVILSLCRWDKSKSKLRCTVCLGCLWF